jgi:hypothetical protein
MRVLYFLCFLLVLMSLACAALPIQHTDWIPGAPTPQNQTASSGAVLFQDDFSRPITGWERLQTEQGTMDYDGGGYRILVNALQTNFWSTPHQDFANVRMEVDVGKLGGPDENRIGLICRFAASNYYFFMITSDGFYGIGIFAGGQAALLGQSEMQSSEKILKGMTVNHLRGDCVGDMLTLYINGSEIATVLDPTLKSGDIGLLAGTFGGPGVDVIFDNFVVLQP